MTEKLPHSLRREPIVVRLPLPEKAYYRRVALKLSEVFLPEPIEGGVRAVDLRIANVHPTSAAPYFVKRLMTVRLSAWNVSTSNVFIRCYSNRCLVSIQYCA